MNVDAKFPEWFEPYLKPARYKSASGGRGSGKSYAFAQLAVLRMRGLLPGYPAEPFRIPVFRESKTTIAESVKIIVEHYINEWGLVGDFDVRRDWIDCPRTGSHMWFPAYGQNPNSIRSVFKVDALWATEAQFLQPEHMEVVIPSIFRDEGDGPDQDAEAWRQTEIWLDWNPLNRTDWAWQRFVVRSRPGDIHCHTTWQDNPWFPRALREERAAMLIDDPERERHVYGGDPDDGDAGTKVLTRTALEACIQAFRKGLAPKLTDQHRCESGLDLGHGGVDKCAQIIRRGPVVQRVDLWPGIADDHGPAAQRAVDNCDGYPVTRLYHDAGTPGMRGEIMKRNGLRFGVRSIGFGNAVNGPDVFYEIGRPNKLVFARLNIQMADALRLRANRTVRLLNGATDIDPNKCLFIDPDCVRGVRGLDLEGMLADLGRPIRRIEPETGKWKIDKRGGEDKSPDLFDGLCLSYWDDTRRLRAR